MSFLRSAVSRPRDWALRVVAVLALGGALVLVLADRPLTAPLPNTLKLADIYHRVDLTPQANSR